MAAKLPQSIIGGAPRGARPSTAAVDLGGVAQAVSDIGGDVSAVMARHKQVADEADDREAERMMTDFQTSYEPALQARAAQWDGQEPGFARRELQQFDAGLGDLMGRTDKPGVRLALRRRADAARAGVASRTTGLEAARRAEPIRQAQLAERATQMTGADIAFNDAYTQDVKPLYDSYDGKGGQDLVKPVLERFDAAVARIEPTVPEAVRADWRAGMAGQRAREAARAMEVEGKARAFATISTAGDQTRLLVNQVITNPALYDDNLRRIDDLAIAIPAGEPRTRFLAESRADAAVARVQGLVKAGQGARAKAELSDGRYDAMIPPETKARLLAGVDQPTVADYLRRGEVEDRAASDVAAAAATGQTGATSTAEVEATLGPAAAAEYQRRTEQARKLYGMVGPLHTLDQATIEARRRELRPDPRAPDYAAQQQRYEIFDKAVTAEYAARAADPAAWGMAEGGGNEASDFLRARFEGWARPPEGATPADRAAAARAYAAATWRRQEQAGIPAAQRRILPKPVAAGLAGGLQSTEPGARARALGQLAETLREFGPYAGSVASELRAAGAPAADVQAAAMTQGEPGRMSGYVAAATNPAALKPLPDRQQEKAMMEAARIELAPYFNSIDPLPGARQLFEARQQAIVTTARHLVLEGGMKPEAAVKEAARMAGDYAYGGPRGAEWRMPRAVSEAAASRTFGFARVTGVDKVELETRQILRELLRDDGAGLYIAKIAPNDPARRGLAADHLRTHGAWVTAPDDSGLMLMVPGANGTWAPVYDVKGRPVRRSWRELLADR